MYPQKTRLINCFLFFNFSNEAYIIKLSIIIPTCDRLNLLGKAINSIQFQMLEPEVSDFFDIDIVIVNDGANVSNQDILNMTSKFNNFKMDVIKNNGVHNAASARNLGVEYCVGELVTFLDDDDQYLSGRLNSLLKFYVENKAQYSFISSGRVGESNNLSTIHLFKKQSFGLVLEEDIKLRNDIDIGFLVEKKRFISKGGFPTDMKAYEDWSLILRLLEDKPAYKISRFDYLVNNELGRPRVSDHEFDCCEILARKHGYYLGHKWKEYILNFGLYKSGKLKIVPALNYFIKYKSFVVLKWYFFSLIKDKR